MRDPRRPPRMLPDYMGDRRSTIEIASDEYAAGRLTLEEFEFHVENAIRQGE